jgi:hypothetical protein
MNNFMINRSSFGSAPSSSSGSSSSQVVPSEETDVGNDNDQVIKHDNPSLMVTKNLRIIPKRSSIFLI